MKPVSLLLLLVLTLSGCTAVTTHADKDRKLHLADCRRFFVLVNLNDNHGIAPSIVRALKARGLEADSGPFTMLPETAQAVVVYDDKWAWDFSTHMVQLTLGAQVPTAVRPFATVSYQNNIAFGTQLDDVVNQLVAELLTVAK